MRVGVETATPNRLEVCPHREDLAFGPMSCLTAALSEDVILSLS